MRKQVQEQQLAQFRLQTHHLGEQHQQQLRMFWQQQMEEVEELDETVGSCKHHDLPLASIKNIMKSDQDVRMIASEAFVLFAKVRRCRTNR
jgi:nuclear transcription factor Y gamma